MGPCRRRNNAPWTTRSKATSSSSPPQSSDGHPHRKIDRGFRVSILLKNATIRIGIKRQRDSNCRCGGDQAKKKFADAVREDQSPKQSRNSGGGGAWRQRKQRELSSGRNGRCHSGDCLELGSLTHLHAHPRGRAVPPSRNASCASSAIRVPSRVRGFPQFPHFSSLKIGRHLNSAQKSFPTLKPGKTPRNVTPVPLHLNVCHLMPSPRCSSLSW